MKKNPNRKSGEAGSSFTGFHQTELVILQIGS
jgi:hypothetical protein